MSLRLIEQHPAQKEIAENDSRFKVVVTGRRWGKSVLGREIALKTAFEKPRSLTWIVTPTREMAKDIHWEALKQRCRDLNWRVKVNESNLSIIRLMNGSQIILKTADNPDRLRGRGLDLVIPDEFGSMNQEVWAKILRPALTDKKGSAVFISTPNGKDVLFELYNHAQTQADWKSWHYTTMDSPFIDSSEIEQAKRELDKYSFAQEYLASFETGGNPPYYAYTAYNHSLYSLNNVTPVIVACDFNATEKPMSWVIGQRENNSTHWIKTFSHTFTNTQTMCEIVQEYLKSLHQHYKHIIFYGDYAGKQEKSNSSFSDWQIIEHNFKNFADKYEKRIKPCKSIRDSIASTNAQLCNTLNERKQFVNVNECTALVRDWEGCQWKDNSKELKENDPLRGHACRAVDYYNDFEFPMKGTSKTEIRQHFN